MPWTTGLASAVTIKLSSSIDDVVWLSPFLTTNTKFAARIQNAGVYVGVCLIQTIVAMIIAYSGDCIISMVVGHKENMWSTDKILTVGAGFLLAIYSIKLAYEYWEELGEDNSDKSSDEEDSGSNSLELGELQSEQKMSLKGNDEDEEPCARTAESTSKTDKKDSCRQQTLFVIAFLGSMDDLTLFVPMLAGKGFDFVQLMLGAFSAASTIVVLCMFIGFCKPVANVLSSIPLCLIVITFAVALLVKGAFMP